MAKTKTKPATAEALLSLPDSLPKRDSLDGFGEFKVQILTSAERAEYISIEDGAARRAVLIQIGILDLDGKPLFTLEQATKAIAKRSPIPEALVSKVLEHNQVNSDPDAESGNES